MRSVQHAQKRFFSLLPELRNGRRVHRESGIGGEWQLILFYFTWIVPAQQFGQAAHHPAGLCGANL